MTGAEKSPGHFLSSIIALITSLQFPFLFVHAQGTLMPFELEKLKNYQAVLAYSELSYNTGET